MYSNKIAYLIPVYNHENYIVELLESIKEDIISVKVELEKELIIIDDGSTDNCHDIINNWCIQNKNLNIKYKSRENKGLTITLNELIQSTTANYLRLCASDDILIPGSSAILLNEMQSQVNLLAVCGNAIIINNDGKELFKSSIEYHGGNIDKLIDIKTAYDELILHWCIAGPSSLIKKEFYDDIKYLENESIDDFYLYLKLIEKDALKIISDKLCYYRVHDTNTSKTTDTNKRIKNLKSFLRIIESFDSLKIKYKSILTIELLTITKINFLERKYLNCSYYLFKYLYYRVLN